MSEANPGKKESDQDGVMSIFKPLNKLSDGIYETYFRPYNPDGDNLHLSGWSRFLYAWAGSLTLFIFGFLDVTRDMVRRGNYGEAIPYIVVYMIATIFYGFLIKSANTNHGPVRLYLSGLLLSCFVFTLLKGTPVAPNLALPTGG